MKCEQCGQRARTGAAYCTHCGADLDQQRRRRREREDAAAAERRRAQEQTARMVAGLGAFGSFALIIFFVNTLQASFPPWLAVLSVVVPLGLGAVLYAGVQRGVLRR